MHATGERRRELKWYHAGAMLFGDWGTSRLYVLGLAYAFTGHASPYFTAAMCVLLVWVGLSYMLTCRLFPDGGGVYSSAKQRSQLVAVIGALLLCADYVVTASLSCLDAFHYVGIKEMTVLGVIPVDAVCAAGAILAVGVLNWFGATKAGAFAMLAAVTTIILTAIIAAFCVPHLSEAIVRPPQGSPWKLWVGFTELILALSGVEAIANMTGIMVTDEHGSVTRTTRKTILPVLTEIVLLNLILAWAMNALPVGVLNQKAPDGALAHTGDMLKVIAAYFVDRTIPYFSQVSAIVFALLLLSAVNTAVGSLASVQFMLSRDKELPGKFKELNKHGMPWLPLVIAAIVPAVVVLIFPKVEELAGLYAIGVVGAISINLGTTSFDSRLKPWQRASMVLLTMVMVVIGITICIVKPNARSFALIVLVVGLAGRLWTIASNPNVEMPRAKVSAYAAVAVVAVLVELWLALEWGTGLRAFFVSLGVAAAVIVASNQIGRYRVAPITEPGEPVIAPVEGAPAGVPSKRLMILPGAYKPKARIMVPTLGNPKLIDFALRECKNREAELQLLFVRQLAAIPMGTTANPTLAEDQQAQDLFDRVREQTHQAGVPLRLLYGISRDVPDAILDMAVTHGADLVLLGLTKRGALMKALKGDVIQGVAEQLPESIDLLIHA